MTVVTMIDTTGASATADKGKIPTSVPVVGGYVTGTGVVPWTAADWAMFPSSVHIRIDQSPNAATVAAGGADAYDLESGACTVAELVIVLHARVMALGAHAYPAAVYATRTNLAAMYAALVASESIFGATWWYGKVWAWLADWNLDEAEAAALVGTNVEGFSCVAVQWASPSSNPSTLCPGTSETLSQLNVDLSAAHGGWNPVPPAVIKPTLAQAQAALQMLADYVDGV